MCRCRRPRRPRRAAPRARPIRWPGSPMNCRARMAHTNRRRHAARRRRTLDIPAIRPWRRRSIFRPANRRAAPQPAAQEAVRRRIRRAGRRRPEPRRYGATARGGLAPPRRAGRQTGHCHACTRSCSQLLLQASSAPNAGLASAPRIDSVNGARDKAAKPEPAAAPDEGGAAFGSLEQEMASLLGRPTGKHDPTRVRPPRPSCDGGGRTSGGDARGLSGRGAGCQHQFRRRAPV